MAVLFGALTVAAPVFVWRCQDADQANMDAYLVDAIRAFGDKVEAMYYGNATGAWHTVARNGTSVSAREAMRCTQRGAR